MGRALILESYFAYLFSTEFQPCCNPQSSLMLIQPSENPELDEWSFDLQHVVVKADTVIRFFAFSGALEG